MSTTALQPTNSPVSITETRMSVPQMLAQRQAIVEAMERTMKVGIDYGIIPNTPKPTLYKSGSEKLLSLFHLAASPMVEDLSTPDCIRYRVTISITHAPTGGFLGQGIGEASSAESKYQWRAAVCNEEWEEFPEDRRRRKWKKGNPAYFVLQVRADMDDVANTVLKMAKKRAQMDAVLTVTAASDIFAQDLEDLKANGIDPGEETPTTTPAAADELKRKTPPAPAQTTQPGPTSAPAAANVGAAVITEQEGKRFWAVAMERTNDYKAIMDYLKNVHGVTNKAQIMKSRLAEAMVWAEKGIAD
jgi:hypothetical protein